MESAGKHIQLKFDSARMIFGAMERLSGIVLKPESGGGHRPLDPRTATLGQYLDDVCEGYPCKKSREEIKVRKSAASATPTARELYMVVSALQSELAAHEMRYALSTAHLFLKAAIGGESGKISAREEFARTLSSEDFTGSVDSMVRKAESTLADIGVKLRTQSCLSQSRSARGAGGRTKANKISTSDADEEKTSDSGTFKISDRPRGKARQPPSIENEVVLADKKSFSNVCVELQKLLDSYPRPAPPGPNIRHSTGRSDARHEPAVGGAPPPMRVDYEKCPECNSEMSVDPDRSELRCLECGTVRELVGTVFDDSQFYSQEGQKAKSGTFNPNRHFQFWWAHIYAREPEEEIGDSSDGDNQYGEKTLARMREIVRRDKKILRLLTVNDIRTMLRELGLTDLNKNVALFLKKLTGIGPPMPSEQLSLKIEKYFSKAIEIGENVKRDGRVNRNYYPFYIFRLIDALLPRDDDENRRVLYYIYLQSDETLKNDDADWELICADPEMSDIKYVPTDRTMPLKYRPL